MAKKISRIIILLLVLAGTAAYAEHAPLKGNSSRNGYVETPGILHYLWGGETSFVGYRNDTLPSAASNVMVKSSLVLDTVLVLPGSTRTTSVRVLAPEEMIRSGRRYPVLYILDAREPGLWKVRFDSLNVSGYPKGIWVMFALPESDSAAMDSVLWLASLKSFIEKRYPVHAQTANHHLAGTGGSGSGAFRLLLQQPKSFGNGIFFLENEPFNADALALLRSRASALSGKYCFVLSENEKTTTRENWLDSMALLSTGIIYAHFLKPGKGNAEAHFPLAYAWLMADGPNKIVNSGD